MVKGDLVLNAMGNMLYYSVEPIFYWKKIHEICKKHNCDGLFFLERINRHSIKLRYFDNDGTENFCGNACRSVSFVLDKEYVLFDVDIYHTSKSYYSKKIDNEYETTIKILKFERLAANRWMAFVGNKQVVTVVEDLNFDITEEAQKIQMKYGNVTCSFVKIVSKNFAKVRVFEDNNVGETLSCCSSASVVARAMWDKFRVWDLKLKYCGGTFTVNFLPNIGNNGHVKIRGGCKIEKTF